MFDTEAEALKDIFYASCEEIHGHISFGAETQDWLSDVFLGVVKPEPIEEGEDEPLPAAERQEETEGQDFPDTSLLNTEDRQRELAPDVFPTFKTMLTVGQERTQELIEMVNSKLMSEERALKEIKKKAQSPVKEQIDRKKQTIEMFKRLSCYLDVAKAIEDARLKSKMEDLTYHVYAIPADNGAWVKTGSGQDILDDVLPSAKHTCSTSPNSPTVNLPEQKRGITQPRRTLRLPTASHRKGPNLPKRTNYPLS